MYINNQYKKHVLNCTADFITNMHVTECIVAVYSRGGRKA